MRLLDGLLPGIDEYERILMGENAEKLTAYTEKECLLLDNENHLNIELYDINCLLKIQYYQWERVGGRKHVPQASLTK